MAYEVRVTEGGGCVSSPLDHVPNLEEAQAIVGGWVEVVHPRATPSVVLLVNEEGWVKNPPLPLNLIASDLYGGPIAGNVVVIERKEKGAREWC